MKSGTRIVLLIALALIGLAPLVNAQTAENQPVGTIVALGDSLTEGYGLAAGDAYPAQLERRLQAAGYNWKVINAGVSGETSSGTLARIDWILKLNPDIVILATGANDGLRGLDPQLLKDNLNQILAKLHAKDVTVVLAGMKMVRNLGEEYLTAFDKVYQDVAAAHGVIFMPFLLEGIAMDPELNLSDGIHPNPRGYQVLVEHLYPHVVQALGGVE